MGKYFKNVLISFGIIALAWVNISFVYRTKREISEMTETINGLSSALEESKQNGIDTKNALNAAEDKIKNLVSQKVKEEDGTLSLQPKPVTIVKKTLPVTVAQSTPTVFVAKPVIDVVRPSRVSRAS